MADTLIEENVIEKQEQVVVATNPFAEESWDEKPVNAETIEEKVEEKVIEQKVEEKIEEKVVIAEEKKETETIKIVEEEKKVEPFKYANETSEKIHKALLEGKDDEVYTYLDTKKKLDKLTTSEVNKFTAEEIVKLKMKSNHPDLTNDEINHSFNKSFSIPKEPVQGVSELDEDYEERKTEWSEKVKEIEMDLLIEAKKAKPELEKLKSELKLPETNKDIQQIIEPTPEELEAVKKNVDNFLQAAEASINSMEGFNTEYKDEDVTVQSNYSLSVEEKKVVAAQMKTLAENNFDVNAVFAERWVNDDNTLNTSQMVRDLSLLQSDEKIMQKLVNDSVAKRLAEYRKTTSNIKVDGKRQGTFIPGGEKNETTKMAEFFFQET